MAEEFFAPQSLYAGKDRRIAIPQQHCKKIAWVIGGSKPVRGWLLVLVPGRFRLLSDSDVERDERLSDIRSLIIDGPTEPEGTSPIEFESNAKAAVIGRLVPVSIDASSRIVIPKEVLPDDRDRWTFVLLFSLGYLEMWLVDVYNAALACPLDSAL
jgi:hypothetical protein